MSKEQRDKIYEECRSFIMETTNGNPESSMLYGMADEMNVPYLDTPDFNNQEPTKFHHLLCTYLKLDGEYAEKLFHIILHNVTKFSKYNKYVFLDKKEFENFQKFMYQNGKFFDEDGIIFEELIPAFLEVYDGNLNKFKEYLEPNHLPVFKNILLCSAYSHGCYEIAKENIDVLERISKLEVIEPNDVPLLEKIFAPYLLDIINSKDGWSIDIDYMLQLKEYLTQTLQNAEKADILFKSYMYTETHQNLATLEGILLNNLYGYTPTPYLEIQLRKNQFLQTSPEDKSLFEFYQNHPQFKLIGNILKYCVENDLESAKALLPQKDNGISHYANLILGAYTVKCDVTDNLCLLLGKDGAYNEPTDDSDDGCIIL